MRLCLALAGLITLTASSAALAGTPDAAAGRGGSRGRLLVGTAQLPVFVSQDWSRPLPGVHRVVIVVHGYRHLLPRTTHAT